MNQLPHFVELAPDGRWIFYIDHHLVNTFNTCEAAFELMHVKNLRGKGRVDWKMAVGQWWSHFMQDVYDDIQRGTLSQDTLVQHAAFRWDELEMAAFEHLDIKHYDAFGGKEGAVLMAVEYLPQAQLDAQQWKIIAVEAGYGLHGEVPLGENDKVIVNYVGKPDKVILQVADERLIPVDDKTVDNIEWDLQRKYKPHAQTAGYIFAVGHLAKALGYDKIVDRCIINCAARKAPTEKPRSGKKKPRFVRVYPNYSASEIEEWRLGIMAKATRMRYCIENNEYIWKEQSCHIYSGCNYRRIHSVAPESRQLVIDTDFVQVKPWKPYEKQPTAEVVND